MDATKQLVSLDRFLGVIYGGSRTLADMLAELGFDRAQAEWLRAQRLQPIAVALVEALRKRLTSGEKDLWFRLLARRYGLDGEPPLPLEEAARALNVDPGYASQAQSDALQKCRTKGVLEGLQHDLHRIALDEIQKGGMAAAGENVVDKLKRLAELRAALDMTRIDYESRRAEVLQKVQAELDALETEYQPLLDAAQDNAEILEGEIKNDVLVGGKSVSTDVYQAIYMKGRVTWDSEGITRYAEAHPDVLKFRKVGNPSVALRTVGKGSD